MNVDKAWLAQYLADTRGQTNQQSDALRHLGIEVPEPKPETKQKNARTGKRNQAAGRDFEDIIAKELEVMYHSGRGLVYKVDAKSRVIKTGGNLRIIYESQSPHGPPVHPPDFLGLLDGTFVAFDAKVRKSGDTYYIAKRDAHQHRGLERLGETTRAPGSFVGYVILWPGGDLGFCPWYSVDNSTKYGAVRKDNCILGESFTDLFATWCHQHRKSTQ